MYRVTEKCQDGWFKGTSLRTAASGVFPGNYVTPVSRSVSSGRGEEIIHVLQAPISHQLYLEFSWSEMCCGARGFSWRRSTAVCSLNGPVMGCRGATSAETDIRKRGDKMFLCSLMNIC